MDYETIPECLCQTSWVDLTTAMAGIAAILAAVSAFNSYRLSKRIYDEIKSDEVVIAGPLHHLGLFDPEHDQSVLRCTLFNKSRRKAYISSVKAFDENGQSIEIKWSDSADKLGNIVNPTGLIGLENSVNLILRRNDGKSFGETVVSVSHSFSSEVLDIVFEPYKELEEQG